MTIKTTSLAGEPMFWRPYLWQQVRKELLEQFEPGSFTTIREQFFEMQRRLSELDNQTEFVLYNELLNNTD
jgi:hypothetical protein